jgi:hypothetical protein
MAMGYALSDYQAVQVSNMRRGIAQARKQGGDFTTCIQVLAMMYVECTFWNYSNPKYPANWQQASDGPPPKSSTNPTGFDSLKNSVGVAQQRPHIPVWWGPAGLSEEDQVRNFTVVEKALSYFLDRLLKQKRDVVSPWNNIQAVQGSEYDGKTINPQTRKPYPYAENYKNAWPRAVSLYAELSTLDSKVPVIDKPVPGVVREHWLSVLFNLGWKE